MTDITWTCADFFCGAGGMVGGYEATNERCGARTRRICTPEQVA